MKRDEAGAGWGKTPAGILLPPGAQPQPCVERAEFAVKVRGFAPQPPYDVELVGHLEGPRVSKQVFYDIPVARSRRRK